MTKHADRSPRTSHATIWSRPRGAIRVPCVRLAAGIGVIALVFGCSANVKSLLFDGVPAPPPPQEYCAPYLASLKTQPQQNVATSTGGNAAVAGATTGGAATPAKAAGSVHPPYQEKRCADCHDRTKPTGMLYPKNELCLTCHDYIIDAKFTHAPAGSGWCVMCHLPHDSTLPRLLKAEKGQLCGACHTEQRLFSTLHQRMAQQQMACYDCHNPHAGDNRYFLK